MEFSIYKRRLEFFLIDLCLTILFQSFPTQTTDMSNLNEELIYKLFPAVLYCSLLVHSYYMVTLQQFSTFSEFIKGCFSFFKKNKSIGTKDSKFQLSETEDILLMILFKQLSVI